MKKIFAVFSLFFLIVFLAAPSSARATSSDLAEKQKEIEELEKKLTELASQKQTLSSQINYMDSQIKLTVLRINKTKEEIEVLSGKISRLEISLDALAIVVSKRIEATYKKGRAIEPISLLFSSQKFSDFLARHKYLKIVQAHDKKLLLAMEETRINYDEQKEEVEELKAQLETQKSLLDRQRREKESLLEVTKNDEKRYQEFLAEARRELQALLASKFTEKRQVGRGEVIGLMGSTGFSTGPHLHFGVYSLSEGDAGNFNYHNSLNPFQYLAGKSVFFDKNSCNDVPEGVDRVAGEGSWDWPMNDPRITQCYGHTPWSWMYGDNFHHGVDLVGRGSLLVRAIEEGMAYFYRGQTSFGNNIRVFHPDGKMTLYLHLQ